MSEWHNHELVSGSGEGWRCVDGNIVRDVRKFPDDPQYRWYVGRLTRGVFSNQYKHMAFGRADTLEAAQQAAMEVRS